mmetsp:Transcript_36411/g.79596  ORF Transcript_36411/g.79596 Transcript_36411/m.79596 type:complete len:232 (+) Transcript_36411:1-696(+)
MLLLLRVRSSWLRHRHHRWCHPVHHGGKMRMGRRVVRSTRKERAATATPDGGHHPPLAAAALLDRCLLWHPPVTILAFLPNALAVRTAFLLFVEAFAVVLEAVRLSAFAADRFRWRWRTSTRRRTFRLRCWGGRNNTRRGKGSPRIAHCPARHRMHHPRRHRMNRRRHHWSGRVRRWGWRHANRSTGTGTRTRMLLIRLPFLTDFTATTATATTTAVAINSAGRLPPPTLP